MNWFTKWFGVWTAAWWICLWNTVKGWFQERYEIVVSFNREYGDADDKKYIAKKIYKQTEKHLKFKDEDDQLIEIRTHEPMNWDLVKVY